MATPPKSKKERKPYHSKKRATALRILLENQGISVSEAMKRANYSPSMAKNPQLLTRSTGYAAILDQAGLTDKKLSELHSELAQQETLETIKISYRMGVIETKTKKGKRKVKVGRVPFTEEELRKVISSVKGLRFITTINNDWEYTHSVLVAAPVGESRRKGLELAYKNKGHMAAIELDLGVVHELDEADQKTLQSIFASNRK